MQRYEKDGRQKSKVERFFKAPSRDVTLIWLINLYIKMTKSYFNHIMVRLNKYYSLVLTQRSFTSHIIKQITILIKAKSTLGKNVPVNIEGSTLKI